MALVKEIGKAVELTPKSKLVLIDADTIAYRAASKFQNDMYRIHKAHLEPLGLSQEDGDLAWQGKREAYAWGKKKDIVIGPADLEKFVESVGEISAALATVKRELAAVIKQPWVKDFRIYLEGEGNFREQRATLQPYKGNREGTEKPELLKEVVEYIKTRWEGKVITAEGIETDDKVSLTGWKWYRRARRMQDRDKCEVVLAFVDKDLRQIAGYHWNYQKPDDPVLWMNDVEGFKHLCWQCLLGDDTDHIAGLTKWSKELSAQWGLAKRATIGEVGCWNQVKDLGNKKELAQKVIDIYKSVYGAEPFEQYLEVPDKTEMITWDYILNENAALLWMLHTEDEVFVFTDYAEDLGCEI
jgi:hypothetical protein